MDKDSKGAALGCLFWIVMIGANLVIWFIFKNFWGWLIPGVLVSIFIYGIFENLGN